MGGEIIGVVVDDQGLDGIGNDRIVVFRNQGNIDNLADQVFLSFGQGAVFRHHPCNLLQGDGQGFRKVRICHFKIAKNRAFYENGEKEDG